MQERRVDHAEDRRRGADAQGHGQNRGSGEARRPGKLRRA